MLAESARLAAERRDDQQAGRLTDLAGRFRHADDAQALDFAFFAEIVDAARNVVLVLVMNSIRRIYFDRAELFAPVVADREALAPLYARAARAIERKQPDAAARAVAELAAAQQQALMESLPS
jgi:DNA-binding FadR family transcriptional regulator